MPPELLPKQHFLPSNFSTNVSTHFESMIPAVLITWVGQYWFFSLKCVHCLTITLCKGIKLGSICWSPALRVWWWRSSYLGSYDAILSWRSPCWRSTKNCWVKMDLAYPDNYQTILIFIFLYCFFYACLFIKWNIIAILV